MKRNSPLLFVLPVILFFSCNSNEIGSSQDVNPESIYFDYKVWGEEASDHLTIKLQYRFGGENGTTLTMDEPAKVELDNENIPVDSSRMNGAFYEIQKPLKKFTGDHIITFTNYNKKQYREKFSFQPLQLKTALPGVINRGDLILDVDGIDEAGLVRVILTDTLFASEGINRIDTVRNGRILITKEELEALVNGPVQLELIKEEDRPLENSTREGGRISISYGLKREIILAD